LSTSASAGGDGHATYAPNGSRIIFVRDQGSGDELWMMRTDGSGQHRLRKVYRYGVFGIAWQPAGGASS
jgi:Tol biopolymer transport system component